MRLLIIQEKASVQVDDRGYLGCCIYKVTEDLKFA